MTDADKMNAYDDRVCSVRFIHIFSYHFHYSTFCFFKKAMWTVIETGDKELQRLPIAAGSCPAGINECGKMTDAGLTGTVCCCNTELCNGATTIQQQSLLVYLIIGILVIITDSWF